MKRTISKTTALLCVICCLCFCAYQTYAISSPHTIANGGLLGYNCIYSYPWCQGYQFPVAYNNSITATWKCQYEYKGDNRWQLLNGPLDYLCDYQFLGCCTMPASGDCTSHANDPIVNCEYYWYGPPPDE